uniref:Secreted protein n=1 Tax=Knipowitschia caucasica TaxID=637954 RepID=A0AAV2JSE4_KNICA
MSAHSCNWICYTTPARAAVSSSTPRRTPVTAHHLTHFASGTRATQDTQEDRPFGNHRDERLVCVLSVLIGPSFQ